MPETSTISNLAQHVGTTATVRGWVSHLRSSGKIAFIVLPLVVPAARDLGIVGADMVWFGVMIAMNLQTSFLTPPFGFALFYLRGVAPESVSTTQIYRGVVPFIAIQAVGVVLVVLFPGLVKGML